MSGGLLVSIDGPGGVGKSTLTTQLAAQLTRRGIRVHATTEPSPSPLGDFARHAPDHYKGLVLAGLPGRRRPLPPPGNRDPATPGGR